jgi:L,D-peptidoglycan transpeptidase YkuD (ErfK/YbiS/YcfS/YnhG family)
MMLCIVHGLEYQHRAGVGCGSAIFFHLSRSGFSPTEGCIALKRADMTRLLPHLTNRTVIRVLR